MVRCVDMLKQLTHESTTLIFLDELGVTSAHAKAFPLMWALCEQLMCLSGTLSLIATHNSYLRPFAI